MEKDDRILLGLAYAFQQMSADPNSVNVPDLVDLADLLVDLSVHFTVTQVENIAAFVADYRDELERLNGFRLFLRNLRDLIRYAEAHYSIRSRRSTHKM
jgi:hypothetical protein